jgi:hypothetical protein
LSVAELKSELTLRGAAAVRATKPELQLKLCQVLSIDCDPSQLQDDDCVTLATLDKVGRKALSNRSSAESSPARSVTSVRSSSKPELSSEQLFELEKMRLQTPARLREAELQMRAEEIKAQFELERRKVEHQHELELAKVNSAAPSLANLPVYPTAAVAASSERGSESNKYRIDVLTKIVSRFDPTDVHLFFTSFERTLKLNKIPNEQ